MATVPGTNNAGNGDPTNHQPNTVSWRAAFHGLARGLVQVTTDAASPDRDAVLEVDIDRAAAAAASVGGGAVVTIVPTAVAAPTAPIVVRASAPGLAASTVSIPVGADPAVDGVLAVAARSVELAFTD